MDFQQIETKWQQRWARDKVWEVKIDPTKKKYYVLDMFPYPSGRLHMGHVRNYTLGDVIARFRRAQGYHVMHPMGWDAFGLPAENAAIKNKTHPEKWTLENISHMKKQLQRLGLGYDWTREVTTCLPDYYRWEQLFFIQMFEKGLAYKKGSTVNWCPSCATVLANEQVEDGKCWRCDSETTTRELEQWFLRTTRYADELLRDLETLKGWPERVLSMQRHWMGRSEGAEIHFSLENKKDPLVVFTTRPDTLMGVTFLAIAPEHPWAKELCRGKKDENKILEFIEACRKQDRFKRTADDAPKEGVFTGSYATHPLTQEKIPVYIANFVLMDYGTGALMAVPAHDVRDHAFATKYKIPIKEVIRPKEGESNVEEQAFTESGILVRSGSYDGMESEKAKASITQDLEARGLGKKKIQFKLRDWGLSRQRYWGAPIPMIECKQCGHQPVRKEDLPVILPSDIQFTGEGGSPLGHHPGFIRTQCPKCGDANARRETDTMDTFMESSWYYLRYTSPGETDRPFDPDAIKYWLGVDQYIGGIEHATMHLLYFRFFHKVLRDFGYFPEDMNPQDRNEPVRNLLNQGIVYKDGAKMSKSKGNVVEPDAIIQQYGADAVRLFSMFAAPPEKVLEWSDQGVEGTYRFINRICRLVENHVSVLKTTLPYAGSHKHITHEPSRKIRQKTHQTIAKVHKDFEAGYHFNTAIAALMELVNELYAYPFQMSSDESRAVMRESLEVLLRLLCPFAPHVAEELWEMIGGKDLLTTQTLPIADPEALEQDTATIVIQVNGKLRGSLEVSKTLESDRIIAMAKEDAKVQPHLQGKTIVREIFVPGKLLNFVVKG